MLSYPAKWEPDENGGYFIQFIDIPDAFTEGDTMEELVEMAEDVLAAVVGCMIEDGIEVPRPSIVKGENILYVDLTPETALPLFIKEMRKEMGFSQEKIAKKMKIPYQTYQRWEKASNFNPTLKTLKRIAGALGKNIVIDFQ